MPRAALGIRVHSGWGALVAVTYVHGEITTHAEKIVGIWVPHPFCF